MKLSPIMRGNSNEIHRKGSTIFEVSAEELAPWLLGKVLCCKQNDEFIIRGRICETEAYRPTDKQTDANRDGGGSQLLSSGHIHYHYGGPARSRFDIVAGPEGSAESVLIRGIDPYGSHPANSLAAMSFDMVTGLDGYDLLAGNLIWLEDDGTIVKKAEPKPRVGIPSDEALNFRAIGFTFKE